MENQQNKEYELPQVAPELLTNNEVGQTHLEATEAVRLEQGQAVQQTPLQGAVSVQQVPYDFAATTTLSSTVGQTALVTNDLPAVADDLDLIEKEWVEKAKHIVRVTLGDPYNQNKELSKMKADYIKKRYNKDIKTID